MSNAITNIERFATGYAFTLDTPPATGWDVWLNGQRLQTQLNDTYYFYTTSSNTPPPIEVVAGNEDTASSNASTQILIQWQHYGASHYIVERSTDNVTFLRYGTVYANGNIFHNFIGATAEGTTYYRVYAAVQDQDDYRKTSLPLPCSVTQALIPTAPNVRIDAESGNAIITEPVGVVDDTLTLLK